MRTVAIPLFLLGYYIAVVSCQGYSQDYGYLYDEISNGGDGGNIDVNRDALKLEELYKRNNERYAFGLGKRRYVMKKNNEGQLVPKYDFGIGKRATPYSFGLGKRRADEVKYPTWRMVPMFSENTVQEPIPISTNLKRGREDESVDRRSSSSRYNFGLGKR